MSYLQKRIIAIVDVIRCLKCLADRQKKKLKNCQTMQTGAVINLHVFSSPWAQHPNQSWSPFRIFNYSMVLVQ
ncbi:hypothetical protein COOONC_20618 [Cooperia oncophora]